MDAARVIFARGHKALHEKQCDYLSCVFDTWKLPIIRLLAKVHKPILSARLIVAATCWLTNPLAVLLSVLLQPIVASHISVAHDTQDVLDLLQSVSITPDLKVFSYDVEKLYPSIRHDQLIEAVVHAVTEFLYSTANPCMGSCSRIRQAWHSAYPSKSTL